MNPLLILECTKCGAKYWTRKNTRVPLCPVCLAISYGLETPAKRYKPCTICGAVVKTTVKDPFVCKQCQEKKREEELTKEQPEHPFMREIITCTECGRTYKRKINKSIPVCGDCRGGGKKSGECGEGLKTILVADMEGLGWSKNVSLSTIARCFYIQPDILAAKMEEMKQTGEWTKILNRILEYRRLCKIAKIN